MIVGNITIINAITSKALPSYTRWTFTIVLVTVQLVIRIDPVDATPSRVKNCELVNVGWVVDGQWTIGDRWLAVTTKLDRGNTAVIEALCHKPWIYGDGNPYVFSIIESNLFITLGVEGVLCDTLPTRAGGDIKTAGTATLGAVSISGTAVANITEMGTPAQVVASAALVTVFSAQIIADGVDAK